MQTWQIVDLGAEERTQLNQRLQTSQIIQFRVSQSTDTLLRQFSLEATLRDQDGVSGALLMTIVLNPDENRPLNMELLFANSDDRFIWANDPSDLRVPAVATEFCDRIIRWLAMRALPGYLNPNGKPHSSLHKLPAG